MELMDRFYKSPEVAKILGVSLRTLYRYMENGKIKSIRLPSGRHRFTKEQIEEFLYANNDVPVEMPSKPNNINVGQAVPTQSQTNEENEVQNTNIEPEMQEVETKAELQKTYQPFDNVLEEQKEGNTEIKQEEPVKEETQKQDQQEVKEPEQKQAKEEEESKDMDLEAELERLLASLEEDEEEENEKVQTKKEISKTTSESTILGLDKDEILEEPKTPAINENEVMYFYCPYNELRRIARIVEKTATDSGKEYAFTMNAGLSLFFPLDPFSIIHFYVNEKDLDFWKESLQLKESSKEDANIGILVTKGSAFDNVREVSGLKVVNKERLIENLKANGLDNLVQEAEEKL